MTDRLKHAIPDKITMGPKDKFTQSSHQLIVSPLQSILSSSPSPGRHGAALWVVAPLRITPWIVHLGKRSNGAMALVGSQHWHFDIDIPPFHHPSRKASRRCMTVALFVADGDIGMPSGSWSRRKVGLSCHMIILAKSQSNS